MATGTIKSNTLKYVGSGTTVDISNVKASEFVVIPNVVSGSDFSYSIVIPSEELSANARRFFSGYGYQGSSNMVQITATTSSIRLDQFLRDGNNVTSSASIKVYYR